MPVVRNQPRLEFYAALRCLFRALVAGVVALAIVGFESGLQGLVIELTGRATWAGIPLVPAAALLAAILALAFLASTVRRISRWLTALKHVRMLKDPRRVALVPPLPSHLGPLTPTLGRQIWWWAGFVLFTMALLGVATLMQYDPTTSTSDDPEDPLLVLAGAVLLLLVALFGLADTVLRWRRARRAARRSRSTDRVNDVPPPLSVEAAAKIPPLTVTFFSTPAESRELRAVTAERNVFGRPPWNITYLRLFDNERGLQQFLKDCWRECGHVHFIRDVDSVCGDELDAIDNGARLFIGSRDRLVADLESRPSEPLPIGARRFDGIAAESVEVDDSYGSYPVYAALCHENFWKEAIDILLERADVVVLDLSGYHWNNLGTGYELQRVIDRFPIERCVFLTSSTHTDTTFLEAQIQRGWSQMASGSPNAGDAPRQVIVANSAGFGTSRSSALASMLQDRLELVAPYRVKVTSMSALGAAEQARREAARRHALAVRRGKSRSTLGLLLRWWGVPGF